MSRKEKAGKEYFARGINGASEENSGVAREVRGEHYKEMLGNQNEEKDTVSSKSTSNQVSLPPSTAPNKITSFHMNFGFGRTSWPRTSSKQSVY